MGGFVRILEIATLTSYFIAYMGVFVGISTRTTQMGAFEGMFQMTTQLEIS